MSLLTAWHCFSNILDYIVYSHVQYRKEIHSYFKTKYLSLFLINNLKKQSSQSHTQALHFASWARALGHRRHWGSKAEQIFTGIFCFRFPVSICLFCVSPQRESKQGMGRGEPAHGQHFSIKRLSGNWSWRGQDRMWPWDFCMESRCGIQPEMTPAGSLPISLCGLVLTQLPFYHLHPIWCPARQNHAQ